jgi:hypothetical protein
MTERPGKRLLDKSGTEMTKRGSKEVETEKGDGFDNCKVELTRYIVMGLWEIEKDTRVEFRRKGS